MADHQTPRTTGAHTVRVLFVEDDPAVQSSVGRSLRQRGFTVHPALTCVAALEGLTAFAPNVVLLDLELPDGHGLALLPRLLGAPCQPRVVVLSGSATPQHAADCILGGAMAYVGKPADLDKLASALLSAAGNGPGDTALVGTSPEIGRIRRMVRHLAGDPAPVLLAGEAGTGKHLVAHELHRLSPRRAGPFVAVSCAELAESLHAAEEPRLAAPVTRAAGGTLLISEVERAPASGKSLLRGALESYLQPGSDAAKKPRLVFTCRTGPGTERGLSGTDPLLWLATVKLDFSPLRERGEDVLPLAEHFLREGLAARGRSGRVRLGDAAAVLLQGHAWPGNIAELRGALEGALSLCEGPELLPEHLPPAVLGLPEPRRPTAPSSSAPFTWGAHRAQLAEQTRAWLAALLQRAVGNHSAAARAAGMDRANLVKLLRKHGMV